MLTTLTPRPAPHTAPTDRASARAARLPLRALTLILLVLGAAGNIAVPRLLAQTFEPDSFHNGTVTTYLRVSLDSLGILAADTATLSEIDGVLLPLGLSIDREDAGGFYVLSTGLPRPRAELVELARQVRLNGGGLIVDCGLVARLTATETAVLAGDGFLVQFKQWVDSLQIDSLNAENGVDIVAESPYGLNHYLLKVTQQSDVDAIPMAYRYHESTLTEYAVPNLAGGALQTSFVPDDPLFDWQWHLRNTGQQGGIPGADIDAVDAWDVSLGDPDVTIAVVEIKSSFDITHPDLKVNLWENPGEVQNGSDDGDDLKYVDDLNGLSFWNCGLDSDPEECATGDLSTGKYFDHGNAVAGVVAGATNGAGIVGVCPNCRLMLLGGAKTFHTKAAAIAYAHTMGARVINNSWNMTPMNVDIVTRLKAAANDDKVIVFSMWNDFPQDYCSGSEADMASLPEVIAVSASDNKDKRVTTTSYGDCVDLLAPGYAAGKIGGIATADLTGPGGYNNSSAGICNVTEISDLDYTACFGGTSAGAAIVSGVAGLMLSRNPNLDRLEVQDILQNTAEKIDATSASYNLNGFSLTHGYGRVNASQALMQVPSPGFGFEKWLLGLVIVVVVIWLFFAKYWKLPPFTPKA